MALFRARVPLEVLRNTIQPFPTFADIQPCSSNVRYWHKADIGHRTCPLSGVQLQVPARDRTRSHQRENLAISIDVSCLLPHETGRHSLCVFP